MAGVLHIGGHVRTLGGRIVPVVVVLADTDNTSTVGTGRPISYLMLSRRATASHILSCSTSSILLFLFVPHTRLFVLSRHAGTRSDTGQHVVDGGWGENVLDGHGCCPDDPGPVAKGRHGDL